MLTTQARDDATALLTNALDRVERAERNESADESLATEAWVPLLKDHRRCFEAADGLALLVAIFLKVKEDDIYPYRVPEAFATLVLP